MHTAPKIIAGSLTRENRAEIIDAGEWKTARDSKARKKAKNSFSFQQKVTTKREIIERKRAAGNDRQKREVSGQNGTTGISPKMIKETSFKHSTKNRCNRFF